MNYKKLENDTGKYINGQYVTKNGFYGLGCMCPRGGRLYDKDHPKALFNIPNDTGATENWIGLNQFAAPGVMPYYAISNYGRLINVYSGKVLKENFRPSGYGYFCLASEKGETKYTTHRLVMQTFEPNDNPNLVVNHINEIKSDNYINKTMPDGSIESNLEWVTYKENTQHSINLHPEGRKNISDEESKQMIKLYKEGVNFKDIQNKFNKYDYSTIRSHIICSDKNIIRPHKQVCKLFVPYIDPDKKHYKLSQTDLDKIIELKSKGLGARKIQKEYFPNISVSTISICLKE